MKKTKHVIFVIGFNALGKTYYIRNQLLPELGIQCYIDILDIQKRLWTDFESPSPQQVFHSYWLFRRRILEALADHDTVVAEHTLLKRIRRAWYISKLRRHYGDAVRISCHYFVLDDFEKWCERYCQRRKSPPHDLEYFKGMARKDFEEAVRVFEPPDLTEGFDEVRLIK